MNTHCVHLPSLTGVTLESICKDIVGPLLTKLPSDKEELIKWSSHSKEAQSVQTSTSPLLDDPILAIVLYIVNRKQGKEGSKEVVRILHLVSNMLSSAAIPEETKDRVTIQVSVSCPHVVCLHTHCTPLLQLLQESELVGPHGNDSHHLRSVAFSVFTRCPPTIEMVSGTHPLTGFGPAVDRPNSKFKVRQTLVLALSAISVFMGPQVKPFHPLYVLSPDPPMTSSVTASSQQQQPNILFSSEESSLFCGYCVSADHRWLLAVVCDKQGQLLDTCIIGIQPNEYVHVH